MIPRLKPYYNYKEILAAIAPVKQPIKKYEKEFAEKFGCKYGVMFSYGRSGLYALLKTWDLYNVEIICPSYTCVVVSHAIVKSGNVPVFVDCAEGSFNMSYDGIKRSITKKTRCIIVTHLFGYAMDVHLINEMVQEAEAKFGHKIYVIQDAAHSYGTKSRGEMVTQFGDAAIFGSNISKIINSIFGGMVLTQNEGYYARVVAFREKNFVKAGAGKNLKRFLYLIATMLAFNLKVYTLINWMERKGLLNKFVKYYDESIIDLPEDWNQFPCAVEAKVGRVQLKKYDECIRKRQEFSKGIIEKFKSSDSIKFLPYDDQCTYSHLVALVEDREKWVKEFQDQGVQLGILIEYSIPYMKSYKQYKSGEYPVSKYFSEHTINFPNWPGVRYDI